jgi:hypothetical protein
MIGEGRARGCAKVCRMIDGQGVRGQVRICGMIDEQKAWGHTGIGSRIPDLVVHENPGARP